MRITPGAVGTVEIIGTINAQDIPGDSFESLAPVTVANTATVLHAGSSGTKSLIIKAGPDNTEAIFIGDSALTDPGTTEANQALDVLAAGQSLNVRKGSAIDASAHIWHPFSESLANCVHVVGQGRHFSIVRRLRAQCTYLLHHAIAAVGHWAVRLHQMNMEFPF